MPRSGKASRASWTCWSAEPTGTNKERAPGRPFLCRLLPAGFAVGRSVTGQRRLHCRDHLHGRLARGRLTARIDRGHVDPAFDRVDANEEVAALDADVVRTQRRRATGNGQAFYLAQRVTDLGVDIVAAARNCEPVRHLGG